MLQQRSALKQLAPRFQHELLNWIPGHCRVYWTMWRIWHLICRVWPMTCRVLRQRYRVWDPARPGHYLSTGIDIIFIRSLPALYPANKDLEHLDVMACGDWRPRNEDYAAVDSTPSPHVFFFFYLLLLLFCCNRMPCCDLLSHSDIVSNRS